MQEEQGEYEVRQLRTRPSYSQGLVGAHLFGELTLVVVDAAVVLAHALLLADPDLLGHLVDEPEVVRVRVS